MLMLSPLPLASPHWLFRHAFAIAATLRFHYAAFITSGAYFAAAAAWLFAFITGFRWWLLPLLPCALMPFSSLSFFMILLIAAADWCDCCQTLRFSPADWCRWCRAMAAAAFTLLLYAADFLRLAFDISIADLFIFLRRYFLSCFSDFSIRRHYAFWYAALFIAFIWFSLFAMPVDAEFVITLAYIIDAFDDALLLFYFRHFLRRRCRFLITPLRCHPLFSHDFHDVAAFHFISLLFRYFAPADIAIAVSILIFSLLMPHAILRFSAAFLHFHFHAAIIDVCHYWWFAIIFIFFHWLFRYFISIYFHIIIFAIIIFSPLSTLLRRYWCLPALIDFAMLDAYFRHAAAAEAAFFSLAFRSLMPPLAFIFYFRFLRRFIGFLSISHSPLRYFPIIDMMRLSPLTDIRQILPLIRLWLRRWPLILRHWYFAAGYWFDSHCFLSPLMFPPYAISRQPLLSWVEASPCYFRHYAFYIFRLRRSATRIDSHYAAYAIIYACWSRHWPLVMPYYLMPFFLGQMCW